MFSNVYLISNIAGGKSTMIEILREAGFEAYEEPVNQWINLGIFGDYNANPQRWGILFQLMATFTRSDMIYVANLNREGPKVFERSPLCDRYVFMPVMSKRNQITDVEINCYEASCSVLDRQCPLFDDNIPVAFIYINTSPETCYRRYQERSREGEIIPLDYLEDLDQAHNETLLPKIREITDNLLIIDGELNYRDDENVRAEVLKKIKDFITLSFS